MRSFSVSALEQLARASGAGIAARPAGGAWLRTPRRCPVARNWVAEATFQGLTAVGGTPVGPPQTLTAQSPCRMH